MLAGVEILLLVVPVWIWIIDWSYCRVKFACPGCEMIVQQQHFCVKCRSPFHQGCAKGYCRPDSFFGPGGRDPDAPPLPYNEDDRFCSPCWDQLLNTTKKKAKTSIFDSAPSSPSSGDDKKEAMLTVLTRTT